MLAKKITKKIFAAALLGSLVFSLLPLAVPQTNVAYGQAASTTIGTSAGNLDLGQASGPADNIEIDYGSCKNTEVWCWITVGFKTLVILALNLVGKLGSIFLTFGAWMVYTMAKYGIGIINLPIISAGFKVSLSLTNLFFVIAIIFMAFGTMLRSKSYNIKSQLKRLIFAAILVNFSFLIAGLFIDVSNVLTANFLQSIHPNNIGTALQPQSLLSVKNAEDFGIVSERVNKSGSQVTDGIDKEAFDEYRKLKFNINEGETGWAVWFKLVQALILADIITWLIAGVLIALGIMILVRNIWIATLLIFMPLVWALGLIPRLGEYQKKWWDNFIRWLIYLPTVTFFVFLAVSTMLVTSRSGGLLGTDFFNNVMQILILLGLLWAAMKAGKAGGVMGAGLAFGVGAFIGSKIPKTLGKAGLGAGMRGAGLAVGQAGSVVDKGSRAIVDSTRGKGLLGVAGFAAGRLGQGIGKTAKKAGEATNAIGANVASSENKLKDIPKTVGAGLAWGEDFVAGKKAVPFGEKAAQEATLKLFNDKYKDKTKAEALDMLSKMDTMSGKEKAALGMLLSKTNALNEVGGASGTNSFKNKRALLEAAYASGSPQLAESIARGLSEKDPEFAAIAKALSDKNSKAKTGAIRQAKKDAKSLLKKTTDRFPEGTNLTNEEKAILRGIFESFDAKKISELPIERLGATAQEYALAQAVRVKGATAMIMNAKASTQEQWTNAIENSLDTAFGNNTWKQQAPTILLNSVQTQINAARAANNNDAVNTLTEQRDKALAWHRLKQTPGTP